MFFPVIFNKSSFKSALVFILLITTMLSFANGSVGYKGIYINSKGIKTWYKAHNVAWGYNGCENFQFNSASNFSGLNLGSFTTVETLQIAGFAVIGWTDNSDWVAGQLAYKVWKQGDAEPGWNYIQIGNYGNNSGATQVNCTSGVDRVVGYDNGTTSVNPGTPGVYNIKIQAFGRMQYNGGSFNVNDGTEVTATFTVTEPVTTNTDYFRSKNSGDWNSSGSWQSSPNNSYWVNSSLVPDNNANSIVIKSGHTITLNINTIVSSLQIESGATFIASDSSPRTLTITKSTAGTSTTLTNLGTWQNGSGGSTVLFSGSPSSGDAIHAISGSIGFQNVTFSKTGGSSNIGVSFGANSIISGTLEIGPGGFVATAPPSAFYANTAILKFNQGSGVIYDVNSSDNTWSSDQVPQNITITSGRVNLKTSRFVNGNLLVQSGSNLTIVSPGTLTINPVSQVLIAGTADFGGQPVTLKSDATGTAAIGQVTGTLSNATNVTVERYIPAKRAWRLLTAPLKGSSANTITSNWQGTNNEGLLLFSPTPYQSNDMIGYTTGGSSPNIYKFGTTSWSVIPNLTTEPLFGGSVNNAFLVYGTGPYNSTNIASGETATTLKPKGELITGNVTYNSLLANKFKLIGNPYASPINPVTLVTSNPGYKIWMADPSMNASGGYITYDGTNWSTPTPSGVNGYIQSGQGFFVRKSTDGSFAISETHKVSGSSLNWFERNTTTESADKIRILLYKQDGIDWKLADGILAVNSLSGVNDVDDADANKMSNFNENIMFRNGTTNLSIEYKALPTETDVQQLRLTNTSAQAYQLRVHTEEYLNSTLTPVLEDTLLGTLTPIPTDGSEVTVPFTGIVASSTNPDNRFRIVYQSLLGTTPFEPALAMVFPNPVQDNLTIQLVSNTNPATFSIANLVGQVIKKGSLNTVSNSISLESIQEGFYLVTISQNGKTSTSKIFVY